MKTIHSIVMAGVILSGVMACESEPQFATVQVWLTDAPGDFESVRIEVMDVELHRDGGDQSSGWLSVHATPALYDLLTLTNGEEAFLGSLQLPAGRISQIRLKLSNRNSVVIDGNTYALKVPSSLQSGLKLQLAEEINSGITYRILLDFDVARSVVDQGNGSYSLQPVIRAITSPEDGAIKGSVDPLDATPAIYAIMGMDTISSAYTDETGAFLLRGLAGGTYTIGVSPNSGFAPQTVENVVVTHGSVTNVGVINVSE